MNQFIPADHVMDGVPVDWETALKYARQSQAWWDRWCPDDGRVAHALAMTVQAHDNPNEETAQALVKTLPDLVRAYGNARAAETPNEDFASHVTPAALAVTAAMSVIKLAKGLMHPSRRQEHWSQFIAEVRACNLLDVLINGMDDEGDEDDDQE